MEEEDKLKRKSQGNARGKEKQDRSTQANPSVEGEQEPVEQKRRIGRGEFRGNCFKCGKEGHRSFECLYGRTTVVVNEVVVQDKQPKKGESLLVR